MRPTEFLADLEAKPRWLRELGAALPTMPDLYAGLGPSDPVLLLGMGSSHYANAVAAARLRAAGRPAIAERASADPLPMLTDRTTVIAVSASGGSTETVDALERLRATGVPARFVALTNTAGSRIAELCDTTIPMLAGIEAGGVACRTFAHTLAVLGRIGPEVIRKAAEATEDLLDRRAAWLPEASSLLLGPDGTWIVAPAHRLSSAEQSALMLREGPRLPAVGCETGDWSHVDVYLTKSLDYRMLLLTGSRWQPELLRWATERGSTIVAVGSELAHAALTVRYRHDELDDVRLLTETLVAELIAGRAWRHQA